nr:hypothetical protein [Tanacetum cinerariifolium]
IANLALQGGSGSGYGTLQNIGMGDKSGKKVYKFLGGKSCAQCTMYSVFKREGDR